MTVLKRILIKTIIFLAVIGVAGGGTAAFIASRQSAPEYAMDQYLTCLIEDNAQRAYGLVDESGDVSLSEAEYAQALTAKGYGLYSSYTMTEQETRRDESGNEYTDYQVSFADAAGEEQAEETFTVRKQSSQVLGLFDEWKVLPDHCFVRDFVLTVPAGSQVYLDGQEADAGWLVTEGAVAGCDQYQIPQLTPGSLSLVIRHPALESVNTTLDAAAGSADYTADLNLKESARNEGIELGVSALRSLYAAAVREDAAELDQTLFAECEDEARAFVQTQGAGFHEEGAEFRSIGVSDFAARYETPVLSQETGTLTVEMELSYHYMLRKDITTTSQEEYAEDGTPLEITETDVDSGNATANLTLSYEDGGWKITALEVPEVPVSQETGAAGESGDEGEAAQTETAQTETAGTETETGESETAQSETVGTETTETETAQTDSSEEIEIL